MVWPDFEFPMNIHQEKSHHLQVRSLRAQQFEMKGLLHSLPCLLTKSVLLLNSPIERTREKECTPVSASQISVH